MPVTWLVSPFFVAKDLEQTEQTFCSMALAVPEAPFEAAIRSRGEVLVLVLPLTLTPIFFRWALLFGFRWSFFLFCLRPPWSLLDFDWAGLRVPVFEAFFPLAFAFLGFTGQRASGSGAFREQFIEILGKLTYAQEFRIESLFKIWFWIKRLLLHAIKA
jgi:hypothetical protein